MKIACVALAAGFAARFGEDKLCRDIDGQPMLSHVLFALPASLFEQRVAVTPRADGRVADIAASHGFEVLVNDHPALGLSESVRVGVSAVSADADAILFAVCDQPYLTAHTVTAMVNLWRAEQSHIIALGHAGSRGNPVIFPKEFFPQLLRLSGDIGGSAVIAANPDRLLLYETDDGRELWDIDTKEDMNTVCSLQ